MAGLSPAHLQALKYEWSIWAHAHQRPPDGDWTTWLLIGGRGAGKTRAGAEWVRAVATAPPQEGESDSRRIALIGETYAEAREVMVEGLSGLRAVHDSPTRPLWQPSRRRLEWPNGAVAYLFSSEDPQALRGPQFAYAWCDELGKWRHDASTWDMLQFALRLGPAPRQTVTTTPRPTALLKRLMAETGSVVTRAPTRANAAFLSPAFLDRVTARYAGTRLGRQELEGELIEGRSDALWTWKTIEASRKPFPPALTRIVVAVDPPVSTGRAADACGLIVAGMGEDGNAYVLEDASRRGVRPLDWARAAVALWRRHAADLIVAEVNQGGDMVATVIGQVDGGVPVKAVRAQRGKWLRAEPVAMLYAQGRVWHAGTFPELEDEMTDFGVDGLSDGRSPDRLDALVWAIWELLLAMPGTPRIRLF